VFLLLFFWRRFRFGSKTESRLTDANQQNQFMRAFSKPPGTSDAGSLSKIKVAMPAMEVVLYVESDLMAKRECVQN